MGCGIAGAPMLLYNNNIGGKCQNRQVVRDGVIQATVSGYPNPTVMWFRDAQRTSRIINDSIYQLLLSGDVSVNNHLIFLHNTSSLCHHLYCYCFTQTKSVFIACNIVVCKSWSPGNNRKYSMVNL